MRANVVFVALTIALLGLLVAAAVRNETARLPLMTAIAVSVVGGFVPRCKENVEASPAIGVVPMLLYGTCLAPGIAIVTGNVLAITLSTIITGIAWTIAWKLFDPRVHVA